MDHSLMLNKLIKMGINDDDLKIFKSYLTNRRQIVFINGTFSEFCTSTIGVPQGSNLGPLLFVLFINDITQLELYGSIQLFADDLVLKYEAETIDSLSLKMQTDMDILAKWMNFNKLILNTNKSKVMIFKNRRIVDNPSIIYNNQELEVVSSFKYLGLIISQDVTWDNHIDHIKSKISPYIFALNKLNKILPKPALESIYYSYIHSHIIYMNPIWAGASLRKLNELYIFQKRAIKYILRVPRVYPTLKLFNDRFRNLHFIIEEQLLLFIYKIINNLIKHNYILFTRNTLHSYSTRNKNDFEVNFFSTEMRMHNVFYKGLISYNNLPNEVKNVQSYIKFKTNLRNYLDNIGAQRRVGIDRL